jgi:hypothetical protein
MCNPPIVARQRLGKNDTAAKEYTRNNIRIFGRVVFYAVRVESKENRRLVYPKTSCFLFSPCLLFSFFFRKTGFKFFQFMFLP